ADAHHAPQPDRERARCRRACAAVADAGDAGRSHAAHAETAMIEIYGLRKRYGALQVLDGVDLVIAPGRVTAVLGPNAAGKTTLIKSILGLTHPDAGTILVNGTEIEPSGAYRSDIGYMPQ